MVEKQIWTSNLNLWFGKNHILHNINLEAYKNNITAIIGPWLWKIHFTTMF